MCGRIEYVVTNKEALEDHYGAKLVEGYAEQGFSFPHYNIPPTKHTPVLTSENNEEILIGHWGYLPSWAKERKSKEVINARAESVLEKPYFKSSIKSRRCLIPVTGYFEWKGEGKNKRPYRFHMDGEIFSLAGLYTNIADESGIELPHYAIITTEANKLMEPIHNRMPVIVEKENESEWLEEGLEDLEIGRFFKSAMYDGLKLYEISTLVNNPRNDSPEATKPI